MNKEYTEISFYPNDDSDSYTLRCVKCGRVEVGNDQHKTAVVLPTSVLRAMADSLPALLNSPEVLPVAEEVDDDYSGILSDAGGRA